MVVMVPFLLKGTLVLAIPLLLVALGKMRRRSGEDAYTTPYTLPILRNTISFVFDGLRFLQTVSRQFPYASTLRIPIVSDEVYLVQGPKHITEIFRNANLTVTRAYSLVLRQCFGMQQTAVEAYIADTSGSRHAPISGSVPRPQDRISYMTHENLTSGLLQGGLDPATDRFQHDLVRSLQAVNPGPEWLDSPDLVTFFEHHIGSSLVRALFGEKLLEIHPDFVKDLWEYDKGVMNLAKRVPRFLIPGTYRVRERLLASVKRWHAKAASRDGNLDGSDDNDVDPLWGSKMMRERYSMLLGATGQNAASVASTDLAFIWAAVTNVVPSTMTLVLHIFQSETSLSAIRRSLSGLPVSPTLKDLESIPLLQSMYAETLRFGVQIHIPRSSPYHDLRVGGVTIPRDRLIIANTWLAHTDEKVWNTKGGERPLDTFWAERFLVNPADETSGPTRNRTARPAENKSSKAAYFSTDGLEGAWIPYGGGRHACPGRLLAKRIMLLSAAAIVDMFDVEILADERALAYGSPRFGFGVRKPVGPVRFRFRFRIRSKE